MKKRDESRSSEKHHRGARDDQRDVRALRDELAALLASVLAESEVDKRALERVHEDHREGARNLLAYVALRHHEIRPLQDALGELGLSSLGRSEAAVVDRLRAVLAWLDLLLGDPSREEFARGHELPRARERLDRSAVALLGPSPAGRSTRIMATVDGSVAKDARFLEGLLAAGVDCIRINACHDDEAVWERILARLREAQRTVGRPCRVLVDLPGPKIRTGKVDPGVAIVKVRPTRDAYGRVAEVSRLVLVREGEGPRPPCTWLPVDAAFVDRLFVGDRVEVVDTRQKRRNLVVESVNETGATLLVDTALYFVEGCLLRRVGEDAPPTLVAALPPAEGCIELSVGDEILVTPDAIVGHAGRKREDGQRDPARIACCPPEVLTSVSVGEHVFFDDGHLGGVVRERRDDGLLVEITQAFKDSVKLRGGKGLNFPDTHLDLPALTDEDRALLPWVAKHADLVGLSFTQTGEDIDRLVDALDELGESRLGIVAKIETRTGFSNLPGILLATMRREAAGVMIARGDLAVECGFERLAELQEEILWVAESAHLPVVWATEVLANAAKTGVPSRAEITDAAMSERAECVMLNKGPKQAAAVRVLDDILRRMEAHQHKKSARLRRLRSF